jgi:signal transduction histidine kinase
MPSPRPRSTPAETPRQGAHDLAAVSLGLRLLALAAVTSSGFALPPSASSQFLLICGVGAGAMAALLQYGVARRWGRWAAAWFVPVHVLVWAVLTFGVGGQGSALFVGFLLEVPLSGALLSRWGCLLAAGTGAGAYIVTPLATGTALDLERTAVFLGFLAVSTVLTWLVIEALERQQRRIEATQAALAARARGLAEELQLLGDYLGSALVSLDESGRVASLNPSAGLLLGVDPREALGDPWQAVLHLDPGGVATLCATLEEGTAQRGLTLMVARSDGRRLAVRADLWVSASPSGRRTYILLDPVLPERSEDPLRRLGEAAACVAHQIKNSIHALLGFVRQIERQGRGGHVGEISAAQYVSALRTLGDLAEDVLGMAGSPRSAEEAVPLHEALASAMALSRRPDVRVQVTLPPYPLYVRAARPRLVHALFNLVDNAARASRPGGRVEVHAESEDEHVRIEIVDSGPGMPATGDSGAVSVNGGSGYGLLAVRRFLEGIAGRLEVSSVEPHGTRCRVTLPRAPAPAGTEVGSNPHQPTGAMG